jgi:hypothetical protein
VHLLKITTLKVHVQNEHNIYIDIYEENKRYYNWNLLCISVGVFIIIDKKTTQKGRQRKKR